MTEQDKKEPSAGGVREDRNVAVQEKLRELREGLLSTRKLTRAELKETAQELLDLGLQVDEVGE